MGGIWSSSSASRACSQPRLSLEWHEAVNQSYRSGVSWVLAQGQLEREVEGKLEAARRNWEQQQARIDALHTSLQGTESELRAAKQ